MKVRIRFEGGPLHEQVAMAESLPECRVFFPPDERQVLLYVREDELVYVFDPRKSRGLTEVYDAAKAKLQKTGDHEELSFVLEDDPGVADEDGDGFEPPALPDSFEPPSEGFEPPEPFVVDDSVDLDDLGDMGSD